MFSFDVYKLLEFLKKLLKNMSAASGKIKMFLRNH